MVMRNLQEKKAGHVIRRPYRLDMVLESLRDSLCMFCVLLRDNGEIAYLISIVGLEVFERLSEIIRNFS